MKLSHTLITATALLCLSGCFDVTNVTPTPDMPSQADVPDMPPHKDMPDETPDETPDVTEDVDVVEIPDETPDVDADADLDETPDLDVDDGGDIPDPCTLDSDEDGLDDCKEAQLGTDPNNADSDYDGLSDSDELLLGTDPLTIDTDKDGLGDFEEHQLGTDPTLQDSDDDGIIDSEEAQYGLDPLKESSFADGVKDGDRFIVSSCDNPASEPIDYLRSNLGDWLIALPAAFSNYVEITPTNALPRVTSAVFDDPVNEIAGFVLSTDLAGPGDPIAQRDTYRAAIDSLGALQGTFLEGIFRTHDNYKAAPGRYEIATAGMSVRQVRDQLLFGIAPFSSSDVTGMPNASGNAYTEYTVRLSIIARADRFLTLVSVAPKQLLDLREAPGFRMSDLTNTTGITHASAESMLRCHPFPANDEVPKADFYWVLDQSGSMDVHFAKVQSFAQDFYNQLSNTALDFRLGITNMSANFGGRIRTNPGWHTDPHTFRNEIQSYVVECTDNFTGCSFVDEHGLFVARQGIQFMRRSNTPQSQRIRPDAVLATIFMSDEEDLSVKEGRDPGGANVGGPAIINQYTNFFAANPRAYSIVGTGGACGENGVGYRQAALSTGGADASLCAPNLDDTINTIIIDISGEASSFRLPQTPISSTLRVFQAGDDGITPIWVPRSRVNGFDYFPQSNTIAFFGSYRPLPGATQPLQVAVHYETFFNRIKIQPQ